MTDQEINEAIYEAVGEKKFVICKPIHHPFCYYRKDARGYTNNINEAWHVTEEVAKQHIGGRPTDPDRVVVEPAPRPLFTDDLNEMYKAVASLPETKWCEFNSALMDQFKDERFGLHKALNSTARQRAEAWLRTIGKWRDA